MLAQYQQLTVNPRVKSFAAFRASQLKSHFEAGGKSIGESVISNWIWEGQSSFQNDNLITCLLAYPGDKSGTANAKRHVLKLPIVRLAFYVSE
jgi:hypothetical protein